MGNLPRVSKPAYVNPVPEDAQAMNMVGQIAQGAGQFMDRLHQEGQRRQQERDRLMGQLIQHYDLADKLGLEDAKAQIYDRGFVPLGMPARAPGVMLPPSGKLFGDWEKGIQRMSPSGEFTEVSPPHPPALTKEDEAKIGLTNAQAGLARAQESYWRSDKASIEREKIDARRSALEEAKSYHKGLLELRRLAADPSSPQNKMKMEILQARLKGIYDTNAVRGFLYKDDGAGNLNVINKFTGEVETIIGGGKEVGAKALTPAQMLAAQNMAIDNIRQQLAVIKPDPLAAPEVMAAWQAKYDAAMAPNSPIVQAEMQRLMEAGQLAAPGGNKPPKAEKPPFKGVNPNTPGTTGPAGVGQQVKPRPADVLRGNSPAPAATPKPGASMEPGRLPTSVAPNAVENIVGTINGTRKGDAGLKELTAQEVYALKTELNKLGPKGAQQILTNMKDGKPIGGKIGQMINSFSMDVHPLKSKQKLTEAQKREKTRSYE